MNLLSAIDLFCGAGGLSHGFTRAGWDIRLGVDSWGQAVETFKRNHKASRVRQMAIDETVTGSKLLEWAETDRIDALIGGPPCQGFSTLGKRSLKDPRNRLIWHFLRLVSELRPAAFLMENVDGLRVAKMTGESLSRTLVREFAALGYHVSYGMLLSANYGVPQLRRRVVFVGLRDDRFFRFPPPTHDERTWPTVWDAIGDLPSLRAGETATKYAQLPTTDLQRRLRGDSTSLAGHESPKHASHLV